MLRRFSEYVSAMPDGERLHPEVYHFWQSFRRKAFRFLSKHDIKAIDEKVERCRPIADPELAKIHINKTDNVTILLGAGASASSGIPTVDELLESLWEKAKKMGRDDLDDLEEWCIFV
jgi:hypothetical protein